MKNFLSFFVVAFLLSFSYSSFAQIVLPDNEDVCPGQEIEYTIQSDYYGENQEFFVFNGLFLVADSLYKFDNDSTHIVMNVTDSTNTFKVKWGDQTNYGGIYLNQNQSYELTIGIVDPPSIVTGDQIILIGQHSFSIQMNARSYMHIEDARSNNITFPNIDSDALGNDNLWTYNYNINGDQPGWVAFRGCYPKANSCDLQYSHWDTVFINRKLNIPTITGDPTICSNGTYTVSTNDNAVENYTWNVTNGLKIYKNGQYVISYTGSESSLSIYKPTTGVGNGEIKVKAHAIGNTDSEEQVKKVWYGTPAVYAFGNNLVDALTQMPMYDFCYGTHNDCQAIHPNGEAYITQWDWKVTGATIYPYGYSNQYATIYPNDYGSFGVEIRAFNTCGPSEWSRMWVTAINCSSYYMVMSPNPADAYVELSFIDSKGLETDISKNKVKIKKDKKDTDENIKEYMAQILDKNGTIRKSIKSKSLNLNIKTKDLEPGTYFLHLTYNDEVYKQQLIIH